MKTAVISLLMILFITPLPAQETANDKGKGTSVDKIFHYVQQFTDSPSDYAYGYNIQQSSGFTIGPAKFPLNNPSGATLLSAQPNSDKVWGASYAEGQWYAVDYSGGNSKLIRFSTTNGARTVVGTTFAKFQGLAYDWTTQWMYAVGYSSSYQAGLYRIGLTTAYSILVAPLPLSVFSLACDNQGRLFTVNEETDYLYEINKTTGEMIPIGYVGFNLYNSVDMEYDLSDTTLYMSSYMYPWCTLRTVNPLTGNTTAVGNFNQQAHITAVAIANNPPVPVTNDVGVLTINSPVNGDLMGTDETIQVTVSNYGTNAVSAVPVHYQVDNGPVVSSVLSETIAGKSVRTFTFSQTTDLSGPENHTIKSWTSLNGDVRPYNDSAQVVVSSYCYTRSKLQEAFIDSVQMGVLSNGSGAGTNGYEDFTSLVLTLSPGNPVPLSIFRGDTTNPDDQAFACVDWNHNGDFEDEQQIEMTLNSGVFTGSVVAPQIVAGGLTRIRLGIIRNGYPNFCGIRENGEFEDYFVNVEIDSNNVGIAGILSPVSSHYLGANEHISVRIFNAGLMGQESIPMKYQVDNGPIITEYCLFTLAPQADTTFTFASSIDLSSPGQSRIIKVWTDLGNDANHSNDTVQDTVMNLFGIYCQPASEGCYTYITRFTLGGIDNITECSPNGYAGYLSLAAEVTRGVTHSMTLEGPGWSDASRGWADWNKNGDFEMVEVIDFEHLSDGTWLGLFKPPYDAVLDSTRIRVRNALEAMPDPCGELYLGEAEDYTLIVNAYADDVGIMSIEGPLSGYFLDSAEHVSVRVVNFGLQAQENFPVSYQINAGDIITETFTASLPPGSSQVFTFAADADFYEDGASWEITAWTSLGNDFNHDNDTSAGSVENWIFSYCTAGAETCDEYIARVVFGTLDNASDCTEGGYADYSYLSTVVNAGDTLYFEIYNSEEYFYDSDSCGIWIDWDRDADFENDPPVSIVGGPEVFYGQTVVPLNAAGGTRTLRVRITYDTDPYSCGIDLYGEVEDYSVEVIPWSGGGDTLASFEGTVNYDNDINTAVDGAIVYLLKDGDTLAQASTDISGIFSFTEVPVGNYSLGVACTKPWGGVNAIDGLLVLRNFVGLIELTGIRLAAADVDGTTTYNAIDGLLILRRFAGVIDHFVTGDWLFEEKSFTLEPSGNQAINIRAVCVGDVNATYLF